MVLLLGEARVHDILNDLDSSLPLYRQVLHMDASNVEAMACMAAHHFYTDQPEVALRFYRFVLSTRYDAAVLCGDHVAPDCLGHQEYVPGSLRCCIHLTGAPTLGLSEQGFLSHRLLLARSQGLRTSYRRLLMMGVANAELWNNLGLCCFYASQYDMTFRCFENALLVADNMVQADVWCAAPRKGACHCVEECVGAQV